AGARRVPQVRGEGLVGLVHGVVQDRRVHGLDGAVGSARGEAQGPGGGRVVAAGGSGAVHGREVHRRRAGGGQAVGGGQHHVHGRVAGALGHATRRRGERQRDAAAARVRRQGWGGA